MCKNTGFAVGATILVLTMMSLAKFSVVANSADMARLKAPIAYITTPTKALEPVW
jgi:hypothetical protein